MKVSILTPAYNEVRHIGEMLDSIRAQSHDDWELLVVDDGSTDGTLDVVREHARADPRINIVSHTEKLGKVRAFNRAFEASDGDAVIICGADDVLPRDSLALRVSSLADLAPDRRAVAYFKLRTFSEDEAFDGMVLPRGDHASRSGPSITMTRALADLLFPVDERLPAEDVWLGRAADFLAEVVVTSREVAVNYRIHGGNSNPRHKGFADMNEAMHARQLAFEYLLQCDRFDFPPHARTDLTRRMEAERMRHAGKPLALLLRSNLPLVDRLALAAMSDPRLYAIRRRFNRALSGHRGR